MIDMQSELQYFLNIFRILFKFKIGNWEKYNILQ